MVRVFDYFNYQEFLRSYYAERHEADPKFSYSFIQHRTGLDRGYMVKIFKGERHLSLKYIIPFARMLHLSIKETKYFEQSVLYGRAKKDKDKKFHFDQMLSYMNLEKREVEAGKYEYYQEWYYTAVREIIGVGGFWGDYAALGASVKPQITANQAKKAVNLLLKLGLIEKSDSGKYRVTSRFLTGGAAQTPFVVRKFQADTLQLAQNALSFISKEERNISTVTLSLSSERYGELCEELSNFRKKVIEMAHEDMKANRVYHLNLSLFPISEDIKGEE